MRGFMLYCTINNGVVACNLGKGRKSHWTFHTLAGKFESLKDAISRRT